MGRGRPSKAVTLSQAERARLYRARKSGQAVTEIPQTVTKNPACPPVSHDVKNSVEFFHNVEKTNQAGAVFVTKTPLDATKTPESHTVDSPVTPCFSRDFCVSGGAVEGDLAGAASDVHVTRHFSLTHETTTLGASRLHLIRDDDDVLPLPRRLQQLETFCDWLSIRQEHGGGLPVIADGAILRLDADGKEECLTLKKHRVEGSHDSSVYIRCDGTTVWFDGNVSKFGRPDNVFGFTFSQCLTRINALLARYKLPPFTEGQRMQVNSPNGWVTHWTGARITRIDLTQNFASGSKENAYHFMRFLGMQQASRLKTGTYGEGETVDFGRGSRRVYSKAYLKGPELIRHAVGTRNPDRVTQFSKPSCEYTLRLAEWCNEIGLVRFETTYKSTYLISTFNQFLGSISMKQLEIDFEGRKSVFTRASCEVEELSSLDQKALAVYRMWQAGDDITKKFSRAQFYRYRSKLLPYGVDIAIKSNVVRFEPKTRVISLGPVCRPDWYEFPSPSFLSLAA